MKTAPTTISPTAGAGIRRFHTMVKPTGSICNLDCTYCYYLHKQELLGSASRFRMSDELLEAHIRQYVEGQDGSEVVFSWQGGEPSLLGIPFFEKVVALEQKHKKPGQRIENDLQTNGTLINEDWCKFLKKRNFLVGLSIDGPEELHDEYRVTKDGNPTFRRVFAASQLLHQYDVPFSTLTVINRRNAQRPLDVYRFLSREIRPWQIQFIPCVEPKTFHTVAPQKWDPATLPHMGSAAARPGNHGSIVTDWSVDPDDWGTFLCKVWDDWYRRDYGRVHVNLFETAVAQWMGQPSQLCIYHEFCGKGMAIEHDGSVYSCDHYVYPEYKLGNVQETPHVDMALSLEQQEFGFAKFNTLPLHCRGCQFLFACNGECPKNRLIRTPNGDVGLNYLCSGLKKFWAHIDPVMPEVLRRIAMAKQG